MNEKYNVELTQLSDAAVEAIENRLGVQVRRDARKPEKGAFLKLTSTKPIKAVDAGTGAAITDELGNGTTAVAVLFPYTIRQGPHTGKVLAKIRVIQVKELKVYGGGAAEYLNEEAL